MARLAQMESKDILMKFLTIRQDDPLLLSEAARRLRDCRLLNPSPITLTEEYKAVELVYDRRAMCPDRPHWSLWAVFPNDSQRRLWET